MFSSLYSLLELCLSLQLIQTGVLSAPMYELVKLKTETFIIIDDRKMQCVLFPYFMLKDKFLIFLSSHSHC